MNHLTHRQRARTEARLHAVCPRRTSAASCLCVASQWMFRIWMPNRMWLWWVEHIQLTFSDVVAGDLPLHICFILCPGGQYRRAQQYTLLLCIYLSGGWQADKQHRGTQPNGQMQEIGLYETGNNFNSIFSFGFSKGTINNQSLFFIWKHRHHYLIENSVYTGLQRCPLCSCC